MVKVRETCGRCGKPRGDSSHPQYCRACKRALERESYARRGGKTPSSICARCREPKDEGDTHPSYCQSCWQAKIQERRQKPCARCGKVPNADDTAHPAYCDECWRAYQRDYRIKNGKREQINCSRCHQPRTADDSHPGYCRMCWAAVQRETYTPSRRRLDRYGLTHERYEEMVLEQGNCCPICGRDASETAKGFLFVDHDHETRAVRKLLCNTCNAGLGNFGEDPALLRRAADYLEAHASLF